MRNLRLLSRLLGQDRSEEGSALVEMGLVSAFVYLPLLFGIIQFSYGLYVYNFVNMAARQATRYAVVRGIESCQIAPAFPNCNMGPDAANNKTPPSALQTFVQGQAYPGINPNNLTVTATWLAADVTTPAGSEYSTTAWDSTCTAASPLNPYNQQECNTPGNAVKVSVVYQFPLAIPFWRQLTLSLTGTSQMVINE